MKSDFDWNKEDERGNTRKRKIIEQRNSAIYKCRIIQNKTVKITKNLVFTRGA